MAMSIGGAVEAMRSGEAVEWRGLIYRYSPRKNIIVATSNGVSTSIGAFTVEQLFAEDWKIHGYEQEYWPIGPAADPGDADTSGTDSIA